MLSTLLSPQRHEVGLGAASSPITERGAEAFHPYSDYESVTRHKRNNNTWWQLDANTIHTVAAQEWPKPKAAIQIRFHLNQLEERPRVFPSLLPNLEKLTKEKEECRATAAAVRRGGIHRNFYWIFFSFGVEEK
uniref:Uncharacterized protein n=1 Tax=Knipowitschia caucasica TaxID=637954 RepID=A0AAV2JPL9_KNICA